MCYVPLASLQSALSVLRVACFSVDYFFFPFSRRGPFGVHDYTFQVKEEDLAGLQSKLTHFTGW